MVNKKIVFVIVAVSLIAVPPANAVPAQQPENPCAGAEKNIATEKKDSVGLHVIYTVQFDEPEEQVCVRVENKGEMPVSSSFGLLVDDTGFSPEMPNLETNESAFTSVNVTGYLSAVHDNHIVKVNAGGEDFDFNFSHYLNASSPEVPTPYISEVNISRDGESPELVATVHNPGERAYGIHVRAETFETHAESKIGAPQPGNTSKFRLELDESTDDVIAGKVMLYDDINQPEGKFDQKEFMAKPNETANAWDDHFEQVPGGTVESDYDNETARQYREGYVDDEALSPLERRAGAALVVLTLIGGVLWRRTS